MTIRIRAALRTLAGLSAAGLLATTGLGIRSANAAPPAPKGWVGRPAPAFRLTDMNGRAVDVRKEFGKRPVVLVYYRGKW